MTNKNMIVGSLVLIVILVSGWAWTNAGASNELDNITVDTVKDAPRID